MPQSPVTPEAPGENPLLRVQRHLQWEFRLSYHTAAKLRQTSCKLQRKPELKNFASLSVSVLPVLKGIIVNPSISVAPKTTRLFWWYLSNKGIMRKIFEGEMFIRTLSTTLLQIFCELKLYSKIIFKNMISPDDTGQADIQGEFCHASTRNFNSYRMVCSTGQINDLRVVNGRHAPVPLFVDQNGNPPRFGLTWVRELVAGDKIFPIWIVSWKTMIGKVWH